MGQADRVAAEAAAVIRRRRGRPKNPALVGRRHEEILAVASEVFAENGYAATDIQLIADRLGIAKGTIYLYFPSKEKLFFAAVDAGMRMLSHAVDAAIGLRDDAIEGLKIAVRTFLSFLDRHPELVELFIQERAVFKNRKISTFERYQNANVKPRNERLRLEMAAGRIRKMPLRRVHETLSTLLYGVVFTRYYTGQGSTFESLAEDIIDIFLHGISARPPQKS